MTKFPYGSNAIPNGFRNDAETTVIPYVDPGDHRWILLFPESTTYTFRYWSTVMYVGEFNWYDQEPGTPVWPAIVVALIAPRSNF
jgi:hypothetical protein